MKEYNTLEEVKSAGTDSHWTGIIMLIAATITMFLYLIFDTDMVVTLMLSIAFFALAIIFRIDERYWHMKYYLIKEKEVKENAKNRTRR